MNRGPAIRLRDILEAAELLAQYVGDLTFDEFERNTEKQDAVARRLEVIGEAVKGLPKELRDANPEVPWRDIAGARDILVHEYFRIDLDLAWEMVQHDVPRLAARVREILAGLDGA